jgi:hypothetical protein
MSTGRARGKHRPRGVDGVDPNSDEGRGLGMSDRMAGGPSPIPGGRVHIVNAGSVRQEVPVPDSRPEITDQNAHGVPPEAHTARERADAERGPNDFRPLVPEYAEVVRGPEPVPVYVVQNESGPRALRSAAPRHITMQANTGDAARLCGQDFSRARVLLLNESTTSDVRFAQRIADLNGGGGALLPKSTTSYLSLTTQDELYAISADSGTPQVSVIQEFEVTW